MTLPICSASSSLRATLLISRINASTDGASSIARTTFCVSAANSATSGPAAGRSAAAPGGTSTEGANFRMSKPESAKSAKVFLFITNRSRGSPVAAFIVLSSENGTPAAINRRYIFVASALGLTSLKKPRPRVFATLSASRYTEVPIP